MTKAKLDEALELHYQWLNNDEDGKQANFSRLDLSNTNLTGANLQDAILQDANFTEANLQGANLQGANLQDAFFTDANLKNADLQNANLLRASLLRANLTGANLQDAILQGANFTEANLQGANLQDVILQGAFFTDANLKNVNIHFANLFAAKIPFVSVGPIGSRFDITYYNYIHDDVLCGCFKGNLAEFEAKVEKTHKNNPHQLAEYRAATAFFKAIFIEKADERNHFEAIYAQRDKH